MCPQFMLVLLEHQGVSENVALDKLLMGFVPFCVRLNLYVFSSDG